MLEDGLECLRERWLRLRKELGQSGPEHWLIKKLTLMRQTVRRKRAHLRDELVSVREQLNQNTTDCFCVLCSERWVAAERCCQHEGRA